MNKCLMLDEKYQLVRTALIGAGIEMSDSIDALYHDWHRWCVKCRGQHSRSTAHQWWTDHLAQLSCLIDPSHVAARGERTRKEGLLALTAIKNEP